jgi:hypothetical protein
VNLTPELKPQEIDSPTEVTMRRKQLSHARCLAWAGLVLLACLGTAPAVRAEQPSLAIRFVGGASACYPVGQVERVDFGGDLLVVVDTTGGSESWGVDTITKIEFLWDPANSASPRDVAAFLKAVHLFQNQPNPFSPETRIAFDLPQAGPVELMIYGVDGRLIRRLVKDSREAGRHTARWDGRDDAGEKVGSGIYFYQLTAPGVEESRRMILLP